ncbi:MAG: HPF/RaiA family ribosome-associated protein [Arenicella sp.]|jgi:putative sigma-54 modulation protein|nr:HPF/RaiA family ribosome-associated protein [Arenicella sp.]HAU69033.1 hypothetical protein [Gammaproteobacteria bacterium]
MKIQIYSNDINLTDPLKLSIEAQAEKRAARHVDRIDTMVIRIKDLNGPKGGKDKQCTVEIHQAGQAPIVVTKQSESLAKAINKALGRAVRTSVRKTRKQNVYSAVRRRRDKFKELFGRTMQDSDPVNQ